MRKLLLFTFILVNVVSLSAKTMHLSIEQTVELAIKNNFDIKNLAANYKLSKIPREMYNAKYKAMLGAGGAYSFSKEKEIGIAKFMGTEKTNIEGYIFGRKKFSTGTFVETKVIEQYYENNANPPFNIDGMYTSSIEITIRQNLLKNFLGYSERKELKALRVEELSNKELIKYNLSTILAGALLNYLNLYIADKALKIKEIELNNARYVLNILRRNRALGTSELADVLQWQSIVNQKTIAVRNASNNYKKALHNFLAFLNLPMDTQITLKTPLRRKTIKASYKKSLKLALENRQDYKIAKWQLKSKKLRYQAASNSLLPNLDLILKLVPKGQDENLSTASQDMLGSKYYQSYIGIEVSYPLGNSIDKIKYKKARLNYYIQKNKLAKIKNTIKSEVKTAVQSLKTSYKNYINAIQNRRNAQYYYQTVLRNYRIGKYNVYKVKTALDTLSAANDLEIQTLVGYNIAIIEYYIAINTLPSEYKVPVNKILNRRAK